MRILDRIISFIFSIIMLVVSIILILVGIGKIEPAMIIDFLSTNVFNKEVISSGLFNPITIAGIVLFLAGIKTTVFLSLFKIKSRAPIVVKTKNGQIQIAQDTITSTARNATLAFDNIKDVQTNMVKKGKGVVINENVQVYSNTNIRELTDEIQNAVREKVTSTTGVVVNHVNIKVKNIYAGKKKETSDYKAASAETPLFKNADINLDEKVNETTVNAPVNEEVNTPEVEEQVSSNDTKEETTNN